MKLSLKLPLAFTVSLLLLFAAALFGISRLNQALDTYQTTVAQSFEHERMAAGMLNNFKVQVQEWKNVLLRGKDPAQLTRYWAAFEKQEKAIKDEAQKLVVALPPGEGRERVQQFSQAHERMGAAYRKGFEAFKAADHDPQAGDKAVTGMDREPSQLLDQAGGLIAKASSEVAERAAKAAQRATTISLVVMLVVCALGIAGAIAFSRTVVNPLDNAVRVSQAVASGDLTVARQVQGKDEIALLLNALHDMQISLSHVVSNVRNNADSVAAASTEIAQGNNDLSARTEQQASALESGTEFVACYADPNNFKPFNDHYGYWRGDQMIRLVARLATTHCDARRDFVGHVGGDDFMLIFQSSNWLQRCKNIVDEFAREAIALFDEPARLAGGIQAEDRHGVQRFFPCTTLAIGAVRVMPGRFRHAEEVANLAAVAKHEAKQAAAGVVLHGGFTESSLGALAAARALQDVLAA